MEKFKNRMKKIIENELIVLIFIALLILFQLFIFKDIFSPNYKQISKYYGSKDADGYVNMANRMLDKKVYGYLSDEPDAYVTPGHPLIVTFFVWLSRVLNINDLKLLQFINVLFCLGIMFLIYLITKELFKSKEIGYIASILFAIYSPNVYYIRSILTEIPGMFFMMLSIYLFIKAYNKNDRKIYSVFSIFYAITIMIRPSVAPLLLIAIYLIYKKEGFKKGTITILTFSLGFFLVVFPWIIRNYLRFGKLIIFATQGGNPFILGIYPFNLKEPDFIEMKTLGMDEYQYGFKILKEGFRENPKLYLSWFTLGKFLYLYAGPSKFVYFVEKYPLMVKISRIIHLIIMIFALIGIYKFKKEEKIRRLACIFIFYTLIQLFFVAHDRYGYFIIPVIMILAAYSMYKFIEKLKIRIKTKTETKTEIKIENKKKQIE